MARDSFYGDTLLWTGKPEEQKTPWSWRAISGMAAVISGSSLAFAIVVASSMHRPVGSMLALSLWCATIALGAWKIPQIWLSRVTYEVTDKHIIWRRGRLRRAIERGGISYAIVRWTDRERGLGDLVLIRAVPTGALRRTLSLTLTSVRAPDRVWSIVRGVAALPELPEGSPGAQTARAARPLAQRLDAGERVLWSAIPLASPWTVRRALRAGLALMISLALVRMIAHALPPLAKILRVHALPGWAFALVVGAIVLAALCLFVLAFATGYSALIVPWRAAKRTRYFVTQKRVLIQREDEELHLDRSRIAFVITAPVRKLHDVFLVLDGPHARALALSGAFGGDDNGILRPVFAAIDDVDSVQSLLKKAA